MPSSMSSLLRRRLWMAMIHWKKCGGSIMLSERSVWSFISHCNNFLWTNVWWNLRQGPTFVNSFVINQPSGASNSGLWQIPLVSPAIVVCTVESNVGSLFLTTDWPFMWSLTSCMHLIIRGIQYTSTTGTPPMLLHALKEKKFSDIGTLRANRWGTLSSVLELKVALSRTDVPRGTGYYIRDRDDVYICWRAITVCIMSNEHPGHSEGMVSRAAKTSFHWCLPNCRCSHSCTCKVLQSVYGRSG